MRIAIIGTAGRKTDGARLTQDHWLHMCSVAEEIVMRHRRSAEVTLVSGGAAWADHVAVALHLRFGIPLELHLPCAWDDVKGQYADDGSRNWRTNPGGTSNYYHRAFGQRVWGDPAASLADLTAAIAGGANVIVGRGFHDRNAKVAHSDVVLAFTFAPGDQPPDDSGTAHTWGLAGRHGAQRGHYSLAGMGTLGA